MDMWPAYIHAMLAFDRFHVAKHLKEAVDRVR